VDGDELTELDVEELGDGVDDGEPEIEADGVFDAEADGVGEGEAEIDELGEPEMLELGDELGEKMDGDADTELLGELDVDELGDADTELLGELDVDELGDAVGDADKLDDGDELGVPPDGELDGDDDSDILTDADGDADNELDGDDDGEPESAKLSAISNWRVDAFQLACASVNTPASVVSFGPPGSAMMYCGNSSTVLPSRIRNSHASNVTTPLTSVVPVDCVTSLSVLRISTVIPWTGEPPSSTVASTDHPS